MAGHLHYKLTTERMDENLVKFDVSRRTAESRMQMRSVRVNFAHVERISVPRGQIACAGQCAGEFVGRYSGKSNEALTWTNGRQYATRLSDGDGE